MKPLIFLHGAIGASDQLRPLAQSLFVNYDVHSFDFTGHGNGPADEGVFSMELFAEQVRQYMQQNDIEKASIFGYSMGGYVAMCLAKQQPELVDKVVTLATKWHWDEATASREASMLNAEKIEVKLPAFAEALSKRHETQGWKEVLAKTATMMNALGEKSPLTVDDYGSVPHPALLLLGDRDKMVSLDETMTVYKSLPNAQLGILPGTGHPIEQVDVDMLSVLIRKFVG